LKEITMTIGRLCCRQVDTTTPDETVRAAAQRMGNRGVGTLVVTDSANRAAGIVTDRDLAVRVLGAGRDPESTRVSEVMTDMVHTCFDDMPVEDVLRLMRTESVRRIVVVGRDGTLVGIASLDDILTQLAGELRDVGELLERVSPREASTVG
jgi:CBS domain-containing protein